MMFEGALADFGKSLLVHEVRPVFAVPELLKAAMLERLLMQVYGPELMPSQLPVLVSQWSKYYFMQLIPPVVAASLVHESSWPLALDELGFALHDRGFLEGLRFYAEPVAVPPSDDPFQRFAPLLDNLQQVVEVLSAYGNVAPGVLWGNAGDYLETCLRELAAVSDVSLLAGYGLLRERVRSDGRRNPLFNAVSYIEQPGDLPARRQRRSCCLSHRVEWVGRCEHCPLHDADPA